MTEKKWRTHSDPERMLRALPETASERKLRLFGCAVCHQIAEVMTDARCRNLVEASERFADKLISESELNTCLVAAEEVSRDAAARADPEAMFRANCVIYVSLSPLLMVRVIRAIGGAFRPHSVKGARRKRAAQADLLRDIFGNPFRPVALDPAWLTTDVVALARGIYDERAFDRMPILADALQDAGCTNEDMLIHCRDTNQTHVRGCWVVDLVLGKT